MGTHIAARNNSALTANGTPGRRRSNSISNVEFQKVKCKILFTALDSSSYLRSIVLIAFNDPSVVLNEHWGRKWKSKFEKSKIENRKSQSGNVRSRINLSVKSCSQPKTPAPACVVLIALTDPSVVLNDHWRRKR